MPERLLHPGSDLKKPGVHMKKLDTLVVGRPCDLRELGTHIRNGVQPHPTPLSGYGAAPRQLGFSSSFPSAAVVERRWWLSMKW